jgi:hypothetical protein
MMSEKGAPESGDEGDYSSGDEYQGHVSALKSALGLDDASAQSLAEAICGLARYEIDESESKEGGGSESPPPPRGKGGVALVIGMGRGKK